MDKNKKRKKQEQHRKNYLNEMMIKAKKTLEANEMKAAGVFNKLSEKTQNKVSTFVADKIIAKAGITNDNTQENIRKYSILVMSMISATKVDPTGQAINKIRQNILSNLPLDIKDFKNTGKNNEEIVKFYWDVLDFQKMWVKLGWDKEYLENLVESIGI